MVRFALAPDGTVTPDLRRRLPGRGVWIEASHAAVAKAAASRVFARAFRAEARPPATLADDVAVLMKRAALERLAIANKAGHVYAGFEKVRALVTSGGVYCLLVAADAAPDGRRKFEALAKKAGHLHNESRRVDWFSSAELEGSLGRERVVHVALSSGRPSELFFMDALRLRAYASGQPLFAEHSETPQSDAEAFAGPLTV